MTGDKPKEIDKRFVEKVQHVQTEKDRDLVIDEAISNLKDAYQWDEQHALRHLQTLCNDVGKGKPAKGYGTEAPTGTSTNVYALARITRRLEKLSKSR